MLLQAADRRAEVVQVGLGQVLPEVLGLPLPCLGEPVTRPGKHGLVEQSVVLAEPGVDAGEYPAGRDLGELLTAPGLEGQAGAGPGDRMS